MKKLTMMLAALSLCACTFAACSDDGDAKKVKNGETCSANSDCESNYCSDAKKCADKPADTPTTDDKAQKDEDCSSKSCADGLKCDDASKKCVEDKPATDDKAQKDEDCSSKSCADGLKCDDASKKCVEDKPATDDKAQKDEDCSSKTCADGLKCDDTSKKCVEDNTGSDEDEIIKTIAAYCAKDVEHNGIEGYTVEECAKLVASWMDGVEKSQSKECESAIGTFVACVANAKDEDEAGKCGTVEGMTCIGMMSNVDDLEALNKAMEDAYTCMTEDKEEIKQYTAQTFAIMGATIVNKDTECAQAFDTFFGCMNTQATKCDEACATKAYLDCNKKYTPAEAE